MDPRVKRPGRPAGSQTRLAVGTGALVEAAWTAVLQPGPLHGFYERTKTRRGHGKAVVATARKLAVLFLVHALESGRERDTGARIN